MAPMAFADSEHLKVHGLADGADRLYPLNHSITPEAH